MKLDREDMIEAVTQGVRQGITDLGTNWRRKDIPHEIVHDAIRQGVRGAIWNMITNNTQMPCADFYDAIKDGVESAMVRLHQDT
jgi:hypothetical protein